MFSRITNFVSGLVFTQPSVSEVDAVQLQPEVLVHLKTGVADTCSDNHTQMSSDSCSLPCSLPPIGQSMTQRRAARAVQARVQRVARRRQRAIIKAAAATATAPAVDEDDLDGEIEGEETEFPSVFEPELSARV